MLKYSVGLDVSSADIHACFSVIDSQQKVKVISSKVINNNTKGFEILVTWIEKNVNKTNTIILPAITSVFIFNAVNIYLVLLGKNIPWFIYFILAITSIITGYFSYVKIKNKPDN